MKHLYRIRLMLRRRRALTALALTGFAAACLVPAGAVAATAGTVPHLVSAAARLQRIPDRMLAADASMSLGRMGRAAMLAGSRAGNWHGRSNAAPAVPVGNVPQAAALDSATRTLYVANGNDGTVSVINAATCNATVTFSCGQTPPTVQVGSGPV